MVDDEGKKKVSKTAFFTYTPFGRIYSLQNVFFCIDPWAALACALEEWRILDSILRSFITQANLAP
jgi:hypothetical protein